MLRTKIVATIGPATDSTDSLEELLKAGINIARLNFSHGTHEEHKSRIDLIRQASVNTGIPVAILLDTKGPEIRIGVLSKTVSFVEGDQIILTTDDIIGEGNLLPVTYKGLVDDISISERILIDDGNIELMVTDKTDNTVICKAINRGEISSRKGVNIPGREVNLPDITAKDYEDIMFAIKEEVDFIAASFVRSKNLVIAIRKILEEHDAKINIIAKIESRAGVDNLDEILEFSDGIMVARGDLGVEISIEEVPMVQKDIIAKCNKLGKPVITATQMLDSMIRNARPTRAEATDVANAIIDGSDAVMLSGETAAGKYPILAVKTMANIIGYTENHMEFKTVVGKADKITITHAICESACNIARDLGAKAIIIPTSSGYTARMMSRYRPMNTIVATTPNEKVARQLLLSWGVCPIHDYILKDSGDPVRQVINIAKLYGFVDNGDLVVVTAGLPMGHPNTTNLLKVEIVGDKLTEGAGIGGKVATGPAKIIRSQNDIDKVDNGDIVVCYGVERDIVRVLDKSAGIVTVEGGLTSHGAIVAMNFKIPAIIGVEDCLEVIPDGTVITIDGTNGAIFDGVAQVK